MQVPSGQANETFSIFYFRQDNQNTGLPSALKIINPS